MTLSELFNRLDLNRDGELSRSDLHESARRLGWHWNEAPVFAVLDLCAVTQPISKNAFIAYMTQMAEDPRGPYGRVLLNSPHVLSPADLKIPAISSYKTPVVQKLNARRTPVSSTGKADNDLMSLLKHGADPDAADAYRKLLKNPEYHSLDLPADQAAVIVIDPQRSFTRGVWMKSIGDGAERDVAPIRLAFEKCARFLNDAGRSVETMFTRCPFPPRSYEWDDVFDGIIDARQLYFIKPGNSVLFPPTNGFRPWVERLIEGGRNLLVMAGCTLNSCVRVSSIETQRRFKDRRLQIVVDLSLSGARARNFMPSAWYGGLSAVESAVREMTDAGVWVTSSIQWT